ERVRPRGDSGGQRGEGQVGSLEPSTGRQPRQPVLGVRQQSENVPQRTPKRRLGVPARGRVVMLFPFVVLVLLE
ncbi:unnamed protein product, partial [Amoebophrya sp. A120]